MLDTQTIYAQRTNTDDTGYAPIVALHCSGSDGHQWSQLRDWLAASVKVVAPDLIGTSTRGHWTSDRPFSLREEAARIVEEIQSIGRPVHIVGHSYGGALGLHIAAHHPKIVRSLCLYEPTAFWMLKSRDNADSPLLAEIENLAAAVRAASDEGCASHAASVFSDFWGGLGSWQALSRSRRKALSEWVPKAWLDFRALIDEPQGAYESVPRIPTTLIVGGETHPQTARIADLLRDPLEAPRVVVLPGATHLGPIVHREAVIGTIWKHVQDSQIG